MANILQITSRFWLLKMGMVNAYLLKINDGLILFDAGWPNKADLIFERVQQAGHNPKDIRHLVLTHGHIDHAGSGAEVKKRTGVRVYAHPADLSLITNGEAEHPGTTVTPGIFPYLINRIFIRPGGTKYEAFSVDETLKDGDELPMAKDIKVIHSPGHCAGHIAFLMQQEKVLIAGDICSNVMGLGYSILNEDRKVATQSILKVADYSFEQAVFGHGGPLKKNANQLLKEKFSNIKIP